jgi:type I restriction enzyme M protein
LENRWKLGRTHKSGKADITVKGINGKILLIIECKTFGQEFDKEKQNMEEDGGQLLSYYQQDKNSGYLVLYASRYKGEKVEYQNSIINVIDSVEEKLQQSKEEEEVITYSRANTVKEILEVWNIKNKKNFLSSGVFEDDVEAYNPGFKPLKIKDLVEFGKEDKGKVYNQFEEILRHNNISDRSNAFNRVISLILAKIVDESKGDNEVADFQIKDGVDTPEDILERLQGLYTKAMKDYLRETVINYTQADINQIVENFPKQTAQENLLRIYKELKYYSNNEFAFKVVYNKELFEENAMVIDEVVRLFQKYKFKNSSKSQFLGDFFELLLESGYKQTEGQFFTPTPIAKFIVSSIPLTNIVKEKISKQELHFLPYVIDFA